MGEELKENLPTASLCGRERKEGVCGRERKEGGRSINRERERKYVFTKMFVTTQSKHQPHHTIPHTLHTHKTIAYTQPPRHHPQPMHAPTHTHRHTHMHTDTHTHRHVHTHTPWTSQVHSADHSIFTPTYCSELGHKCTSCHGNHSRTVLKDLAKERRKKLTL